MQMKFSDVPNMRGTLTVVISHNGRELLWDIPKPNKPGGDDAEERFDVFQQINAYWAQCQPATQEAIFDVYDRIFSAFNLVWETEKLVLQLRPLVAELFEWHPQEDIGMWVRLKSDLLIPPSINRSFDPSVAAGTLERTYLEEDYRKLVPLAVSMRIMIPIWGQFAIRTAKGEVTAVFRDQHAFRLLATANVRHCEAMERLEVFVKHTIPKDQIMSNAALLGISSADFPEWVLASCVVRRLSTGDVRGLPTESNLPACLWVYVTQRVKYVDDKVGRVKEKNNESSFGNDDNNLSRLENFKIKQTIPDGVIIDNSFYIEYWVNKVLNDEPLDVGLEEGKLSLITRLCPDPAFVQIVKMSLESTQALMSEEIHREQRVLAGWVLNKDQIISARILPYLEKTDIIRVIALAQAYLWYYGYRELAALVSAVAKYTNNNSDELIGDDLMRMGREQVEELNYRFPFVKPPKKTNKVVKVESNVIRDIEDVVKSFSSRNWQLTVPTPWVSEITGDGRVRRYHQLPRDIRTKMANLVIELDGPRPAKSMAVPIHSSI